LSASEAARSHGNREGEHGNPPSYCFFPLIDTSSRIAEYQSTHEIN
jgi:hypothetical protein